MASICNELLDLCLRGEVCPPDMLERALAENDGKTFLSVVVERLGDLFEPALCDAYARLFSQVIARHRWDAEALEARYRRVRVPRPAPADAGDVYVLSRVTLGADVAVTRVLIEAAHQAYPEARIHFVGPRKNVELFAAYPYLLHQDAGYSRSGALADRIAASLAIQIPADGVVLDPDSRLSQLGLVPMGSEDRYFLFESRSYGGASQARLPELAEAWARELWPELGLIPQFKLPGQASADITVSLGVGENPRKGFGVEFERALLGGLAKIGASMLVDLGGSAAEKQRVLSVLPNGAQTNDGAFAPFASSVAHSKLFVGYDSAGGHVASACGVPQISIFRGEVSERMFERWRPNGHVLRGDQDEVLAKALAIASAIFAP